MAAIPLLIGFVSLLSPFLGLIFAIAYCGKIWSQQYRNQLISFGAFCLVVLVAAFLTKTPAVWVNASDALVGVGIVACFYVLLIKLRLNLNNAFAVALAIEIVYGVFRSWFYAPTLADLSRQLTPIYQTYMQRYPAFKVSPTMLSTIQDFVLSYQLAIWGVMQITALFVGYLIFNRISVLRQTVRQIRLPFVMVLGMIISIGLALYPVTRTLGINLAICFGMVYLIQGTAILGHFWGNYFARSKVMRSLLIFAVILNYPIMILIALIGLLDVWFDFRKLNNMEEKHESNPD